jgi:alginate O-acetyltransferase complex protein AlgI
MSFISAPFVLFIGVVLAAYQLSPARFRPLVLLVASYAFYTTYSIWGAVLLLGITVAVHQAALALEQRLKGGGGLRLVVVAVAVLVTLLMGFKLASVVWTGAGTSQGLASNSIALRILVPLGLSYYIFKLIGYLLDVYWEEIPAQRNFVALALYASFFPQIVTGPIQRADDFFDQLGRTTTLNPDLVAAAGRRIVFGLFKKLLVADPLGIAVSAVHSHPGNFSSLELLIGGYLFALQLYADFSGVTDIAIGLGQLFGIQGPENFNRPFFARNIQDYWRRWHMSLTTWLGDYLFTPLRMSLRRLGDLGLALALLINMVAIGVWHGVTWTYAAFGLLHGIFLVVSALTLKKRNAFFKGRPGLSSVRAVAAPLITFHLVVLGMIVFRAESLSLAVEYVTRIFPGGSADIPWHRLDFQLLKIKRDVLLGVLGLAVIMEFVHWAATQPNWSRWFLGAPRIFRWPLYYAVLFMIIANGSPGQANFIYAQF